MRNFIDKVALSTIWEGAFILCLTLDIVTNSAQLAHTLLSFYADVVCIISCILIAIVMLSYEGFSIQMLDFLEKLSERPNLIVYMACLLTSIVFVGLAGEIKALLELCLVGIVCNVRHLVVVNALSID